MPSLEDESPQMARYRVEHVQPQEQFCNFWTNLCISLRSKKEQQTKDIQEHIKSQILSQITPEIQWVSSGFPVGFQWVSNGFFPVSL
jgi:hypothetical protein